MQKLSSILLPLCLMLAGCENNSHPFGYQSNRDRSHRTPESSYSRESATEAVAENLPAVDLSIPADWKPHTREWTRAYGAAANGNVDEARRRVVRGEGTIDDVRYGWADYLYQQDRIKTWTPFVIIAGIAAADYLMKGNAPSEEVQRENRERVEHQRLIDAFDDQKRKANEDAEKQGNPKPYAL